MKLVRLVANGTNQFNNDINSDLTLKPYSQIALLNGNFQKKSKELIINSQNDKFTYSIGTYTKTTGDLTHRTIDSDNFREFLIEIQTLLNHSLSVTNSNVTGMGFSVRLNSSNKVKIETEYGLNTDPFGSMEKDDVEDIGNNIYRKDNALNEGVADGAIFYPDDALKVAFIPKFGCGFFRFQLNKLSVGGDGVYIGLADITGTEMSNDYTFNTSKIKYGIYARNTGTNYTIITPDGGLSVSTQAVESAVNGDDDNDILSIECNLGEIRLVVYNKSNPDGVVLASQADLGLLELYPIVGFYDQTDVEIKKLRFTPEDDSEVNKPSVSVSLNLSESLATTLNPPNQQRADVGNKTPMTFTFPSLQFAEFLGFNQETINQAPTDEISLTSNKSVYLVDTSESYIVEMTNLKINSYDGLKQQRKSILNLIQNGRDSTKSDFTYQTNTPIFLNLDNAFPLQVRNIDCRIVNSDYDDVEIEGEANLTILFKEKDE
jgi:hypothetical protein